MRCTALPSRGANRPLTHHHCTYIPAARQTVMCSSAASRIPVRSSVCDRQGRADSLKGPGVIVGQSGYIPQRHRVLQHVLAVNGIVHNVAAHCRDGIACCPSRVCTFGDHRLATETISHNSSEFCCTFLPLIWLSVVLLCPVSVTLPPAAVLSIISWL